MSNADKEKKFARLDDMLLLEDGWIVDAPAPNEVSIKNAKAITTALCALGIEHSVYPLASQTSGAISSGVQFEFNQALLEILCLNSGEITTEEFDDETISVKQFNEDGTFIEMPTDTRKHIRTPHDELATEAAEYVINTVVPGCANHHLVEPHTCPFAEEIHGDRTLCNCCKACEQICADDI